MKSRLINVMCFFYTIASISFAVAMLTWIQVEVINPLFLLTAKPIVYLVNLSEKDYIRQKNKYLPKVFEWIKENSPGPLIPISASFEERLALMADDSAAEEECKKLSTKSGLPKVITTMRQALNLSSFFTTGADEVRQWTIRKGLKAPAASGVIHTGMFPQPHCGSDHILTTRQTLKRLSSRLLSTTTPLCASTVTKVPSSPPERSWPRARITP